MSSRRMSLLPRATLNSDSEHWLSQDSESFFRFYKIPLGSTLTGHEKCHNFPHPGAHTQIHTLLDKNCRDTSHTFLEYWQTVKFLRFKKRPRILRISGFWHFFQICKIPHLKVLLQAMRSAATFPIQKPTHISTQHRTKNVESLCMFFRVLTRSGILQIWKKCQNPQDFRTPAHFSDLRNSTWKKLSKAKRSGTTFPA